MFKRAVTQIALVVVCLMAAIGGQRIYAAAAEEGPATLGDLVARTAHKYLSVRYGEVRDGERFDCSGLVQYVFARHGVMLPRRALEQAAVGDKVDLADLRPGDLLFFAFKPGGSKVAHVGIAIGNGQMIHASTSRQRVVRDEIAAYFAERLIAVRRVNAPMPLREAEPRIASSIPAKGPIVTASAGVGR
jgi:cell wall-associated NlpC family hydrolase